MDLLILHPKILALKLICNILILNYLLLLLLDKQWLIKLLLILFLLVDLFWKLLFELRCLVKLLITLLHFREQGDILLLKRFPNGTWLKMLNLMITIIFFSILIR